MGGLASRAGRQKSRDGGSKLRQAGGKLKKKRARHLEAELQTVEGMWSDVVFLQEPRSGRVVSGAG